MTKKYDMFSYFWIKEKNEPDWKKNKKTKYISNI